MKKIVAFIGSDRKKSTYKTVQEFEQILKDYIEIKFEYVFLCNYQIGFCCGCKQCMNKGQEFCPLKDDKNILLKKMKDADGVIFATPNYAFQVSARIKNLIDRLAYIFHRPEFFGKVFTAIVTQGVLGGKDILKYLEKTGTNLGFEVTNGSCVTTLEPVTQNQQIKLEQQIKKSAKLYYKKLASSTPAVPSLFRVILFRLTRSYIQAGEVRFFDYYFYRDQGWFESDYYYKSDMGLIKKSVGKIFDLIGRYMGKHN